MKFSRAEYKDVIAPYLSTLPSTEYVSYYPEQPIVLTNGAVATYLRLISHPLVVKDMLNIYK